MSTPLPPPPPYGDAPPPPPPSFPPSYQPAATAASGFAGFWSRLGAVIIDGLIGAVFSIPAFIALFAGPSEIRGCTIDGVRGLCEVPTGATIGLAGLLWLTGTIGFLVLYCKKVSQGQSWGHKATGVRIVDAASGASISAGRVFGRQFARLLSGAVCYLGYLWMLWDPKKQTWHDKIVGTVVVRV